MGAYAGYILIAALVGVILGLERLWPASATQRGEWVNNAAAFGFYTASQAVIGVVWPAAETHLINALGGGLIDLRAMPWWIGAVAYLAAMDLGEYVFHRAQHTFPWLWALHSLHHSDRGLNTTTTVRHFWLDPALKSVSVWLAVALLIKVDQSALALYGAAGLWNFVNHANLRFGFGPLSWAWNSPQYHRLHHSTDAAHYNANFAALLPIFDVITGAYHRPEKGEFPPTGLTDRAASPLDVALWPVKGLIRRVKSDPGPQPIG